MSEMESLEKIVKLLNIEESSALSRQCLALEKGEINEAVRLAGQHRGIKIALGTIEKVILESKQE